MCGASTTFGIATNFGCTCGSLSNTSSAAPAIRFYSRASTSAATSTTGPRAA